MAIFKQTPAISISQIAKWLAKLTEIDLLKTVTTLEDLYGVLDDRSVMGCASRKFFGLGNMPAVLTQRYNIRALMTSLNKKSELVKLALDHYNENDWASASEIAPIIVCDETISGIGSMFFLYVDKASNPRECTSIFNEIMQNLTEGTDNIGGLPTCLIGSVELDEPGVPEFHKHLVIVAVQAKTLDSYEKKQQD